MKKFISKQSLAVAALLFSSTGFAATVTVTPSNAAPSVGETFFIDVFGSGFPGDGTCTGVAPSCSEGVVGATLKLTFSSAVAIVTNGITATGSRFTGGVAAGYPFVSGGNFSLLAPTVGALPGSNFGGVAAFRVTFTALAAGAANIVVVDDQGDFSWTDAQSFLAVPLAPSDYTQANVIVQGAVVPAPAALWLLGTGVVALAGRRLSRKTA